MQEQYADPEASIEAGIFHLHNSETCYGTFEGLEELLVKKGIPFDRDSSQDYQIDAGTRIFRPGDPPLDLWLEDFPGDVAAALKGLIKASKEVTPVFDGDASPEWDEEALALEAAIKQAEAIFPVYPPLADYVPKEAANG